MNDNLTPETKEKSHSTIANYVYIFASALISFGFIFILFCSAVIYHIRLSSKGNKDSSLPEKEATSECYPDINNMKFSDDVRYYTLQMGLDLQEFKVTTKDGYILILQRLIDPNHTEEQRNQMKPVLLQHGLLSSSGSFITPGLRSLPAFLLSQGYDVWLGNNRSGFKPLHESYKGDLMHNPKYWDWDVRDLAYYDITCLIDNVLKHKPNFEKLILVGHSQGCTQSFLMLRNPELVETHKKIEHFVGLAPAVFPGSLFHKRKFLSFIGNRSKLTYHFIFGTCCFLHTLTSLRNYLYFTPLFGKMCIIMFHYLFEWTGTKWNKNKKIWHMHFIFNVSLVSAKLMTWWLSYWREESFRNELVSSETFKKELNDKVVDDTKYNVNDDKTFFSYKQQWFNDEIIPMIIFNGDIDNLVDGKRLKTHMETYESRYKLGETLHIFQVNEYSHLDVIWADDLIEEIGEPLIKILNEKV